MEKKDLEGQTLGQRVVCPIGPSEPAYYIIDCRIFGAALPCILSVPFCVRVAEQMVGIYIMRCTELFY